MLSLKYLIFVTKYVVAEQFKLNQWKYLFVPRKKYLLKAVEKNKMLLIISHWHFNNINVEGEMVNVHYMEVYFDMD